MKKTYIILIKGIKDRDVVYKEYYGGRQFGQMQFRFCEKDAYHYPTIELCAVGFYDIKKHIESFTDIIYELTIQTVEEHKL